jgi:hypothetical protein
MYSAVHMADGQTGEIAAVQVNPEWQAAMQKFSRAEQIAGAVHAIARGSCFDIRRL